MTTTRMTSQILAAAFLSLSLGGTALAQNTTANLPLPAAKPQASQPQATQPAPGRRQDGIAGSILSFDPLSNFFRTRRAPLVDHLTYRELERDRFGGDTIDPSGRYDSFFTAPETRPVQRLGQYRR